jgi:ankyrin repeat protein
VTQFLLDRSADPQARDQKGETPLHVAAWEGHGHVVEALLRAAAGPDAADESGQTPLHKAAMQRDNALEWARVRSGPTREAPSEWRSSSLARRTAQQAELALDAVRLLLEAGADVNWPDSRGRTALHCAMEEEAGLWHPEIVRFLVRHGASLRARDDMGRTPQDVAREQGRGDLLDLE